MDEIDDLLAIDRIDVDEDADELRVVVHTRNALFDINGKTILSREHPDLFFHHTQGTVRVGTGVHHPDSDGWHIHAANGIYAEVPLVERELTDAEIAWCEDTFMYAGDSQPETLLEFTIPRPEPLREAILDERLDAYDCLKATITGADERHRVLTDLQEAIETEAVRARQLHPWDGEPIDLEPEWDPSNSHNDDRSRKHLYDMASMSRSAHKADFETVVRFPYREFFCARARVKEIYEPHIDHYELVALDVAGYPDWSYCQECGGVAPAELFLHVQKRHYDDPDRTWRVCDDCLDRRAGRIELPDDDWTRGPWTEAAAARARDERAKRVGGQRRLEGNYTDREAT